MAKIMTTKHTTIILQIPYGPHGFQNWKVFDTVEQAREYVRTMKNKSVTMRIVKSEITSVNTVIEEIKN